MYTIIFLLIALHLFYYPALHTSHENIFSPLQIAIYSGDSELVDNLLTHGKANVHEQAPFSHLKPIDCVASIEVAKILIRHGMLENMNEQKTHDALSTIVIHNLSASFITLYLENIPPILIDPDYKISILSKLVSLHNDNRLEKAKLFLEKLCKKETLEVIQSTHKNYPKETVFHIIDHTVEKKYLTTSEKDELIALKNFLQEKLAWAKDKDL